MKPKITDDEIQRAGEGISFIIVLLVMVIIPYCISHTC